MFVWGSNEFGQRANGHHDDEGGAAKPQRVVVSVFAGKKRSPSLVTVGGGALCCIRADGNCYAWGDGRAGLLGASRKKLLTRPIALKMKLKKSVSTVALGQDRALAALDDGSVVEWGAGTGSRAPSVIAGITGIAHVACGPSHSVAATGGASAGSVYCWGSNAAFACAGASDGASIAAGSSTAAVTFVDSATRSDVQAGIRGVACGGTCTFLVTATGKLLMSGQLFAGGEVCKGFSFVRDAASSRPLSGVVQVAAGLNHALARCGTTGVFGWGDGESAGHGDSAGDTPSATKIDSLSLTPMLAGAERTSLVTRTSFIAHVACGTRSSFAVTQHGNMLSWGANERGQLGQGTTLPTKAPRFVAELDRNVACVTVSASEASTCALCVEGPSVAANSGPRAHERAEWNKVYDSEGALSWEAYVAANPMSEDPALKEMATALMMLEGMDLDGGDAASMTRATDATAARAKAEMLL